MTARTGTFLVASVLALGCATAAPATKSHVAGTAFDVTLEAPESTAETDGPIVARRLKRMGTHVEVRVESPRRFVLTVDHPRALTEVRQAVAHNDLRLLPVAAEPTAAALLPEGREPPSDARIDSSGSVTPCWVAPACEALEPLRRLPEGVTGRVLAVEPGSGEPSECRLRVLEETSIVTGADVDEAMVLWDQTGSPYVSLTLTADGGQRFADWTGANVQRQLSIVLDGKVLSTPLVLERIEGGRLHVTLGRNPRQAEALAAARSLAAALGSGASVEGAWRIVSVRPAGR